MGRSAGKQPLSGVWPLWLLAFLASAASLSGSDATLLLRYARGPVMAGEWWRLLTGHFVHLGPAHLVLNLAGLALLGWLFAGRLRASQWLILLLSSWLCVVLGFVFLEPELMWYVGLSGLLHGLLSGAALLGSGLTAGFRVALVLGVLLKLVWEHWVGAVPSTAEVVGGAIIVDAHLYGGVGGLLAGLSAWLSYGQLRQRSNP